MVESRSRILTRIRHKDMDPTGSWSATLCSNFKSWIFFFLVYPCLRTKHSCNKLSLVMILPQKALGNHHLTAAGRQDVHVCCGAEGEVWFGQARRRHFCTPRKEDLFCYFARTPTSTVYWTHCYQNMEWEAIQKRNCILGPNFDVKRM